MPSLAAALIDQTWPRRTASAPTGYVADDQVAACFAAADACLCLRWPTAGETSVIVAACARPRGTPTVITALAHLTDVPTTRRRDRGAARIRRRRPWRSRSICWTKRTPCVPAMARLSADAQLRSELASAGHAHWSREHRLELMADDYRRVVRGCGGATWRRRRMACLSHFTDDYSALVRRIEEEMGVRRGR